VQPPFAVLDVSGWRVTEDEPGGADEKFWLEEPATGRRCLFKPVTVKDGHVHGEDWGEKAGAELARLLGVARADVDLAVRSGEQGTVSWNLKPPDHDMHNGAVLLGGTVPGYVPGRENPKGRPGHGLGQIAEVLAEAGPPPGSAMPAGAGAFDAFAGMLVLDAWIANRDRHDENWSVLYPHDPSSPTLLCGAYDQAGCLGFNLREDKVRDILKAGTVRAWAERGTAWRFEHVGNGKPDTLVELACRALAAAVPGVKDHWLGALAAVDDAAVDEMLRRIPPVLSDPARTFAYELLMINKGRLLDDCR